MDEPNLSARITVNLNRFSSVQPILAVKRQLLS